MKRIVIKAYFFLIAGLVLSACDKFEVDDHAVPVTGGANVKFYHTSQTAPMLNFYLNEQQVTAGASPTAAGLLRGLAYNTTGLNTAYPTLGYAVVAPGDYTLHVIVPEGSGTTTPAPNAEITSAAQNVKLEDKANYSIFAVNTLENLETLVVKDELPAVSPAQTHIRFVNTMVGAPANFDVELVQTDVTPNVTTRLASDMAFKGYTSFASLPAGSYTYRLYLTGSTTVYYTGTTTLVDGKVYTFLTRGNYAATLASSTPAISITANR